MVLVVRLTASDALSGSKHASLPESTGGIVVLVGQPALRHTDEGIGSYTAFTLESARLGTHSLRAIRGRIPCRTRASHTHATHARGTRSRHFRVISLELGDAGGAFARGLTFVLGP